MQGGGPRQIAETRSRAQPLQVRDADSSLCLPTGVCSFSSLSSAVCLLFASAGIGRLPSRIVAEIAATPPANENPTMCIAGLSPVISARCGFPLSPFPSSSNAFSSHRSSASFLLSLLSISTGPIVFTTFPAIWYNGSQTLAAPPVRSLNRRGGVSRVDIVDVRSSFAAAAFSDNMTRYLPLGDDNDPSVLVMFGASSPSSSFCSISSSFASCNKSSTPP
mmetsp:Transcript_21389/g.46352  ORF Transcript_21389/g.46352 Transcript_21389/m.46352 type:complete len:220 (+) Transcript_21389:1247-1906(+)